MDVYNDKTKPVTNFDFSNDAGFKKAISEAFEKAMDDKRFRAATNNELDTMKAKFERELENCRNQLRRATVSLNAAQESKTMISSTVLLVDELLDAFSKERISSLLYKKPKFEETISKLEIINKQLTTIDGYTIQKISDMIQQFIENITHSLHIETLLGEESAICMKTITSSRDYEGELKKIRNLLQMYFTKAEQAVDYDKIRDIIDESKKDLEKHVSETNIDEFIANSVRDLDERMSS